MPSTALHPAASALLGDIARLSEGSAAHPAWHQGCRVGPLAQLELRSGKMLQMTWKNTGRYGKGWKWGHVSCNRRGHV